MPDSRTSEAVTPRRVDERNGSERALDNALTLLATRDPRAAWIVDRRFFGGLTIAETALGRAVSARTVEREWRTARGWLFQEIGGDVE